MGLYSLTALVAVIGNKKYLLGYATAFLFGVLLHLLLDTLTGGIRWGFPFSTSYFTWVTVPAVHSWWVLNFILHWTFLLELLLVGLAGLRLLYTMAAVKRTVPQG